MTKTFKVQGIDCANCAAKIERSIAKIKGIEGCSLAFMTGRLKIDAPEPQMDAVIQEAKKIILKAEPKAVFS